MTSSTPLPTDLSSALSSILDAGDLPKSWSWSDAIATAFSWGLAPFVLCAVAPLAVTIIAESVPRTKRAHLAAEAALTLLPTFAESRRGAAAFAVPELARALLQTAEPSIPSAAGAPAYRLLPELPVPQQPIVPVKLGEPSIAIPLGLPQRLLSEVGGESVLLITGLPPGATLSSGHLLDAIGVWVVDPRAATSLTLSTLESPQRRHELRIDVLPPDGMISTLALVRIDPGAPLAAPPSAPVKAAAATTTPISTGAKREPQPRSAAVQTAALAKTLTDARPVQSQNVAPLPKSKSSTGRKLAEKTEPAEKPVREDKREQKTELPQFRPAPKLQQKPTVQIAGITKETPIARLGAAQPMPPQPSPGKPEPPGQKAWARAVFEKQNEGGGN